MILLYYHTFCCIFSSVSYIAFRGCERWYHASPCLACVSLLYCQRRDSGAGATGEPSCAGGSSFAGAGCRSSRAGAPADGGGDWKSSEKPSNGDSANPCTTSGAEGNHDNTVGSGRETRGSTQMVYRYQPALYKLYAPFSVEALCFFSPSKQTIIPVVRGRFRPSLMYREWIS